MTAPISYTVFPKNPGAHILEVTLTIEKPDPAGQQLSLPAWIPGSYMIRDFARHIVAINAQTDGVELGIEKTDKSTWLVAPCESSLTVTAQIYAYDQSVRGAHFDTTHAYFNGTCVFLQVHGLENAPCEVHIKRPARPVGQDWRVATSMDPKDAERYGFGLYGAANYDELIDHPVEIGNLAIGEFEARGVPHSIAIHGQCNVDMGRICHDLATVCETHIKFLSKPKDLDRYVFLLTVLGEGYGGLEHRWSSSLVCKRSHLPLRGDEKVSDGYRTFLGLCSHEYFHLWNVKRMKPERFTPYDLSTESHTGLLWVFEGITSYYDDLALVRSGLISAEGYLELLAKTITRVIRGSGRTIQSVEESSFDAWTKFYKQEANASNAIVSYYAKGALIALALDMTLREKTEDRISLDDVMRECWQRYGETGAGMPERGLESIASKLSGIDLSDFFNRFVRGTDELPLGPLLSAMGLQYHLRSANGQTDAGGKRSNPSRQMDAWLGARLISRSGSSVFAAVQADSPAEKAGLAAHDVAIAWDNLKLSSANIDKHLRHHRAGDIVTLTVFRGDELMRFKATLVAPPADTCYLLVSDDCTPEQEKRREDWLATTT